MDEQFKRFRLNRQESGDDLIDLETSKNIIDSSYLDKFAFSKGVKKTGVRVKTNDADTFTDEKYIGKDEQINQSK